MIGLGKQISARAFWWKATRTSDVLKQTNSSAVFRWLSYSARTRVLTAEFRTGRIYAYQGVPLDEAKGLFTAESAGKFFNRVIKPKYPGELLP